MKAVLEFTLPEEKEEFELASKAGLYCSALWDIGQFLRSKEKYGSDALTKEQLELLQEIRAKFFEETEGLDL